jgi:hypothetical protein
MISNRNNFGELLAEKRLFGEYVEVGVWAGTYAEKIATWGDFAMLHLVDPWKHQPDYKDLVNVDDGEFQRVYEQVENKFRGNPRIKIHRKASVEAAASFNNLSLDFVYIDANHEYSHTLDDMNAWFPKVRVGGVFAGHDYGDYDDGQTSFGVKSAVCDFLKSQKKHYSLHILKRDDASWMIVKDE